MSYSLYQAGRRRRRRRAPRRLIGALLVAALALALGYGAFALDRRSTPTAQAGAIVATAPLVTGAAPAPLGGGSTANSPLAVRLSTGNDQVRLKFKRPPRAGLLFDLDTGRVLWRRNPTRKLPIASLTKMMTGLVATDRIAPGDRVRITREALAYQAGGSAVGLLPLGKSVGVNSLLYGLMLPSGNDAARALAIAAGGSLNGFIELMNARATTMGLACTRYASVDGFRDRGNRSCAADLAAEARAVLREPRLARIVRRKRVSLPFPIKGGKLFLSNHNPLLRAGYPGTTGLKTGFTDAAGRCLVATVRRGNIRLGVVLLHSPNPGKQAMQLLDRGFRAARADAAVGGA